MNGNTNKIKFDFSGKTALIIGGAGSIGREITLGFFESGAKTAIACPSESEIPPELKKLIVDKKISFFQTDVLNEKSVESLSENFLKEFGRIDILVFSQGVQQRKPFPQFSLEDWNRVLGVNLTGVFLVCKYFSKAMISQKYGKIVAITSLTSEFGIKNISAYAASKGGMTQFLKSISVELAEHNINVNMVAPGRIMTKMTEDLMKDARLRESNLRCIPLARFGEPKDIVAGVLFLASEDSSYMTGQTIFIDGGWLASGGNPKD